MSDQDIAHSLTKINTTLSAMRERVNCQQKIINNTLGIIDRHTETIRSLTNILYEYNQTQNEVLATINTLKQEIDKLKTVQSD